MNNRHEPYAEAILNTPVNQLLTMWCGICHKPIGLTTSEVTIQGRGLDYVCQKCYDKQQNKQSKLQQVKSGN